MTKYSLGLLTIATNGYTRYLPNLFRSASFHLDGFSEYCHYVFTDNVQKVKQITESFPDTNFEIVEISKYGWPEASLLRYEIYCNYREIFVHDILMHLDSDMYFLSNLDFEVPPAGWVGGMAFVEHPGYFRPNSNEINFTAFRSRIRSFLLGGYGAWETSRRSTAYTPRSYRKTYLCGGAWFGFRENFLAFCETARRNVNIDLSKGITAKWHDESHLNRIVAAENSSTILSSRYCYEPQYGKILKKPILMAVDKSKTLDEQLSMLGDDR